MFSRVPVTNNNQYSISINVKDSNDQDLSNKIYHYNPSEYRLRWIQKTDDFSYKNGKIKVRYF